MFPSEDRNVSTVNFLPGLWIRIHDPDPEFDVGDQYGSRSGSNTDPDPDPIRIQGFNDQRLKKNYS